MTTEHISTLRYWFDIESLTYPELPEAGKRNAYSLRYGSPLPWERQANVGNEDKHKFFVYFGLVKKAVLEAELRELYRTDVSEEYGNNHIRYASGKTFLCAVEVSGNGEALPATLQHAAYSVAFAQRKHRKRFDIAAVQDSLQEAAKALCAEFPDGVVSSVWFEKLTTFLITELDWHPQELLAAEQIYVQTVPLVGRDGKKLRRIPELEPINSFYLDDIQLILKETESKGCSAQVARYLSGEKNAGKRTDCTGLSTINSILAPNQFPAGRWPTKFPLFLMQQVAVNAALDSLKDEGIFAVNGPPGTGKTTLLMDVIAGRIVERAKLLAEFDDPTKAFSKAPETIEYPATNAGVVRNGPCYFLDERLLDFGIVVASANNRAVENITLDLPNIEKVFPQPLALDGEPFDYFSSAAEAILNPEDSRASDTNAEPTSTDEGSSSDDREKGYVKCWGLASVPLGKKANRELVAKFLGARSESGIAKTLEKIPLGELGWESARANFNLKLTRVLEIQLDIARYDKALREHKTAVSELVPALRAVELAETQSKQTQKELHGLAAQIEKCEQRFSKNIAERDQYRRDWPFWRVIFARLFDRVRYAQYIQQGNELEAEYRQLRAARAEMEKAHAVAEVHASKALTVAKSLRTAAESIERNVAKLKVTLRTLELRLGDAVFDPVLFSQLPIDVQQKTLPRSNSSYHQARADVFIAAMHLHKAFVKQAGKPFETNFRLALAMLEQQGFIQKHLPSMAKHLWSTFFLVVPVVSSTFASFSRCFRDLGRDQIGLLLVDEAGQAVPSHALGAIWRSKRALIVGDPLQVEPVMPMDTALDYQILKYHSAPEEHLLTSYSAQHLADRANALGANVRQYDGTDLWVGAPLRVHRRCVDPMFSLSNEIAYNGKMVFGPNPKDELEASEHRPLYGPSRWIDVVSTDYDEHFSKAEALEVFRIVVEFMNAGWVNKVTGLPDLFIISPFKSVALGVAVLLKERSAEWAFKKSEESVANWLKGNVGTVHTFQGKECETVIFVLGGSTSGARSWAASRPNIINVAATRAKRRLYVVGNRAHWLATTFGEALVRATAPRKH